MTIEVGAPLAAFDGTEAADGGTVAGRLADQATEVTEAAGAGRGGAARVKATLAVRALARRLEVDPGAIAPSGEGGAVIAGDVERVAKLLSETEPAEALSEVRRAMARRWLKAHVEVVPAVLRRVLPLSLTFDHRVVIGGEAARFLAAMIAHLARPD